MVRAAIIGIGSATPEPIEQERLWEDFFADHFLDVPRARAIFRRSGVRSRGGCVVPLKEDVRWWTTEQRMRRFVEEAVPLGRQAVERCLADADLDPLDVDLFTAVSCTGYATPGIDVLLARDLGMRARTERVHIGHMGCYAAIPALTVAADAAVARGRTALVLCVELPSLHLQPPTDDLEQVVAHALFADAAAAVAVAPGGPGLEIIDVIARTDPGSADHMTWDVTDRGFRMGLSHRVPAILGRHVRPVVTELLQRHGVGIGQVAGWAVHPGGPKILDVVCQELGIGDDQVETSRSVLAHSGNTSSATVLLILEELAMGSELATGGYAVCIAFGPGLTLYAALLRHTA